MTWIKQLFISNYNHTLFSLWKTTHQSFSYFCIFLVNLWLSQDVFQMFTISLQANLYSSGKVVNHFYTLLSRDGSYFCCDGSPMLSELRNPPNNRWFWWKVATMKTFSKLNLYTLVWFGQKILFHGECLLLNCPTHFWGN